jgi:hypothetical protein
LTGVAGAGGATDAVTTGLTCETGRICATGAVSTALKRAREAEALLVLLLGAATVLARPISWVRAVRAMFSGIYTNIKELNKSRDK